jgi:hypothetical protein
VVREGKKSALLTLTRGDGSGGRCGVEIAAEVQRFMLNFLQETNLYGGISEIKNLFSRLTNFALGKIFLR